MSSAQISVWMSALALIVSIVSLGFSAHFGLRDRGKLRATSRFYAASEYGPARIIVTLLNAGRRPILLRILGGSDAKGEWSGQFLGKDKAGLRLEENEKHEIRLEKDDLVWSHPEKDDDPIFFETLWVEDSHGRRWPIDDAKLNIKKVWAIKKDLI